MGDMPMDSARPSMKEDDHPDHKMPMPEHDGDQMPVAQYVESLRRMTASNRAIQPGKAK